MRESITQLKNPPSPINNRYRPITRTDLSDSVNVKMPIKERKIGHGQTSVLTHRTRQAELLAYDVCWNSLPHWCWESLPHQQVFIANTRLLSLVDTRTRTEWHKLAVFFCWRKPHNSRRFSFIYKLKYMHEINGQPKSLSRDSRCISQRATVETC